MSSNDSFDEELIDIGYGLKLGLKDRSVWRVFARNGVFELGDTGSFFRVAVLLEMHYSQAKSSIDHYLKRNGAVVGFPFWRVVGAGLRSESDQWAGLALEWLPSLPESEQALLLDDLKEVRSAKWLGQKGRQFADRYVKSIEASRS